MPKRKEILWEVGKQLSKDKWDVGDFVKSRMFPISEDCSLEIFFFPEGVTGWNKPLFKRIRSNTDKWMKIKGDIQLCHHDNRLDKIIIAKWYVFDDVFEKGSDCATFGLEDIPTLSKFKIFHSLPDLCYRLIFDVSTDQEADACCKSAVEAPKVQPESVPESEPQSESGNSKESDIQHQSECAESESSKHDSGIESESVSESESTLRPGSESSSETATPQLKCDLEEVESVFNPIPETKIESSAELHKSVPDSHPESVSESQADSKFQLTDVSNET